ncbi:MAG: YbhB/YbcL family Raf kinase inhibitor-like protein [Calditrichia bacterium]
MDFKLSTAAFVDSKSIPVKYTCDGAGISPPLNWEGAPEGAKTFALICDDPDAPAGVWVHWVLYNIPDSVHQLPENVTKGEKEFKDGDLKNVRQGKNSRDKIGYGAPCPPPGPRHRYYFKLYPLDTAIEDTDLSKEKLTERMKGHILAEAKLMGIYQRAK